MLIDPDVLWTGDDSMTIRVVLDFKMNCG